MFLNALAIVLVLLLSQANFSSAVGPVGPQYAHGHPHPRPIFKFNQPQSQKNVLLVIDIQNDFVYDKLAVFKQKPGDINDKRAADAYVSRVAAWMQINAGDFDAIVYSIDYHPPNHCSFARSPAEMFRPQPDRRCITGDAPQLLWPKHCIQHTRGARMVSQLPQVVRNPREVIYVPGYLQQISGVALHRTKPDVDVFYLFKGLQPAVDSYSAFFGNDGITSTGLVEELTRNSYLPQNTVLHVLGIAYDVCVKNTITDATKKLGFEVKFYPDLSAPVFATAVSCDGKRVDMAATKKPGDQVKIYPDLSVFPTAVSCDGKRVGMAAGDAGPVDLKQTDDELRNAGATFCRTDAQLSIRGCSQPY